jgi:hypothetical protein
VKSSPCWSPFSFLLLTLPLHENAGEVFNEFMLDWVQAEKESVLEYFGPCCSFLSHGSLSHEPAGVTLSKIGLSCCALDWQAEKESVLEYFASRCSSDPAKAASIIVVALKYSHILLQLKNCR